MLSVVSIVVRLAADVIGWVALAFRSRQSLHAEMLFLRRQLALYVERGCKPRRIDAATRVSLALLSRLFEWRSALVVVRPQTLIRWHRAGFRLFGLCERVIGTIRRECLDWLIPLSEVHLRRALRSWVEHYNRGRPHMALGPSVPDPPAVGAISIPKSRRRLDDLGTVRSRAVLGGLHHEYSLCPV